MVDKFSNEMGNIMISEEVVAQISGMTAMECYGVVGLAARNMTDGFVQLLKKESATKGISVKLSHHKVRIDFHIIVEYGTKISAIADNLINTVKYKIKETLGVEVECIHIFVEGVRVDRED